MADEPGCCKRVLLAWQNCCEWLCVCGTCGILPPSKRLNLDPDNDDSDTKPSKPSTLWLLLGAFFGVSIVTTLYTELVHRGYRAEDEPCWVLGMAADRYVRTIHATSAIYAFGMLISILSPVIDVVDRSCCSGAVKKDKLPERVSEWEDSVVIYMLSRIAPVASVALLLYYGAVVITVWSRSNEECTASDHNTDQEFWISLLLVFVVLTVAMMFVLERRYTRKIFQGINFSDQTVKTSFSTQWGNHLVRYGWYGARLRKYGGYIFFMLMLLAPLYVMWILVEIEDPRGPAFECVYEKEKRYNALDPAIFFKDDSKLLTGVRNGTRWVLKPNEETYTRELVEIKLGPRITNEHDENRSAIAVVRWACKSLAEQTGKPPNCDPAVHTTGDTETPVVADRVPKQLEEQIRNILIASSVLVGILLLFLILLPPLERDYRPFTMKLTDESIDLQPIVPDTTARWPSTAAHWQPQNASSMHTVVPFAHARSANTQAYWTRPQYTTSALAHARLSSTAAYSQPAHVSSMFATASQHLQPVRGSAFCKLVPDTLAMQRGAYSPLPQHTFAVASTSAGPSAYRVLSEDKLRVGVKGSQVFVGFGLVGIVGVVTCLVIGGTAVQDMHNNCERVYPLFYITTWILLGFSALYTFVVLIFLLIGYCQDEMDMDGVTYVRRSYFSARTSFLS